MHASTSRLGVAATAAAAASTAALLSFLPVASAQKANTFEIVGESGVSAQQMFLGNNGDKVYIIDKTERNKASVTGANGVTHPAWATEYDVASNTYVAMDVISNSFCAGGNVLANGTWLNVGGNNPILWGGIQSEGNQIGAAPYYDQDGGKAFRMLVCGQDNSDCEWLDDEYMYMSTRRWYPTLETLEDGSIFILGGCLWGGYVSGDNQNNPTYEFFPSRGEPTTLNILLNTLPVNLFPLTWLLPSGNILIQANYETAIFDYKNQIEYPITQMPHAVRVYPASAATAMFPLTPANNWTATIIFCGGTNLTSEQWTTDWNIPEYPADASCVTISPDIDLTYYDDDPLTNGRSMGQFINLPDGRLFFVNGIKTGTAGYGNTTYAVGQSFGDNPDYQSWYYNSSAASGSRWTQAATSTVPRLYHSSALLLPDGSVFVSGSNPNADYVDANTPNYILINGVQTASTYKWYTEYRVERFYPDYYDHARPNATGVPTTISYGGNYFDVKLSLSDLFNEPMNILKTKAVIIRTGFSTHAMNMGQRHVELETAFTVNDDGSATLHVSQLPPNPAILAPGPAMLFIVVDGIPGQATMITVGNGQIGTQPTTTNQQLPGNTMPTNPSWTR